MQGSRCGVLCVHACLGLWVTRYASAWACVPISQALWPYECPVSERASAPVSGSLGV